MKKVAFGLSVIGVLWLFLHCGPNVESIMSQVADSVVRVEVKTLSGDLRRGSGFIIDERGFVVTNDHVLGEPDDITIKLHDNKTFAGEKVGIVYRNRLQDIAILMLRKPTPPVFSSLAIGESPNYLEDVYVVGYPFGRLTTATGKMNSLEETILDEFSYMSIDATLDPGYSGAPVVNKKGKVMGIATRIEGKNQNYAVPIRYVRSILDKVGDIYSLNHDDSDLTPAPRGNLAFQDNFCNRFSSDWNEICGDWIRPGNCSYIQISKIAYPFQEGVYGLTVINREFGNFILTTRMKSFTRIDGYKNIDLEVVFRFVDPNNFYVFSTYSGEKRNDRLQVWEQDTGGLWKVEYGQWRLLHVSELAQAIQNERWYQVKIIALDNHITAYVDNLKCIDVTDDSFSSGSIGYRTTSSHAWFSALKVFSLD